MLTNEEMLAVQEAIQYIEIFKQIMICLLICGAKILEISIQSVKTVCMVKGQKLVSAVLGFIECMVWGLVVSSVITTLSEDFTLLFAYCLGYALGLYLGSIIESKIALGTSSVQIMVSKEHIDAISKINHVYDVSFDAGKLIVKCSGGKHNLIRVMDYINQHDIPCGRVYSELPTLNDVFLEITGKELRDKEV